MTSSPAIADNPETGAAQQRASGSSFYLAMRILPRRQREAMFQIYRFCRDVDDIADSDAPHARRLQQLASWRGDIDALYAGRVRPHLRDLARCAANFSLAREDFLGVIEGMEMDAAEDIRAPTFDRLDTYCDRVASAVGRLSVRVFGIDRTEGHALAHHLGRALQLTNILRDLDEDAGMGRLYLPRECLRAAGIDGDDPATVLARPTLARACEPLVERARSHFAEADRIMGRCPRAAVRAPRIMAEVYRMMLEQMARRGWAPPRERVRVSRPKVLWIVLRYALV
jgi:squalene synthase HpnD